MRRLVTALAIGLALGAVNGSAAEGTTANDTDLSIAYVSQSTGTDSLGPTSISTWRITNLGPGTARDVAVTFTVDWGSGPTPIGISPGLEGGQCYNVGTGNAYCESQGALDPNAGLNLVLSTNASNLNTGQSETVPMTTHVITDYATDPNSSNDNASANVLNTRPPRMPPPPPGPRPPGPQPPPAPRVVQLDTTLTPESSTVVVGDTVKLHYEIVNHGQLTPTQYDIETHISGPAVFTKVTPSQGTCTAGDHLVCSGFYLPPDVRMSIDAELRALGSGPISLASDWFAEPHASPLWAYFSSSGGDAALSATPRVADLGVRLAQMPARVRPGVLVKATLLLSNGGPHAVPDPVITITTSRLRVIAMRAQGASCSEGQRCRLTELAGEHSARVVLTLKPIASGHGRISVRVSSKAAADPSALNNSISASIAIATTSRRRTHR